MLNHIVDIIFFAMHPSSFIPLCSKEKSSNILTRNLCINFQHILNFSSFYVVYLALLRDSNATAKTTAQMVVMKLDVVSSKDQLLILLNDLFNKGPIFIVYSNLIHECLSDLKFHLLNKSQFFIVYSNLLYECSSDLLQGLSDQATTNACRIPRSFYFIY